MMPTEAKKAGRPKYNVYAERRKEKLIKRGETSAVIKQGRGLPLPFARKLVLQQAISWRRHHKTGQYHGQRFAWSSDWERRPNNTNVAYAHAEIAMILCGRKSPEKRYTKAGVPKKKPTYYEEFFWLRAFLFDTFDPTSLHGMEWKSRGPQPDPEKIYRTAVSVLTARRFLKPHGCTPDYLPPEKAVAQVWYLLFGEHEKEDTIRKRIPTVAKALRGMVLYERRWSNIEESAIVRLVRPLEKKYR